MKLEKNRGYGNQIGQQSIHEGHMYTFIFNAIYAPRLESLAK